MAYTWPFAKINVEGHFGSSGTNFVERWVAGFHLIKNNGVIGGSSEMTSFLTNIRTAITTFHQTTLLGASNTCFLDAVSGAYIGTDGLYVGGALQSTTRVPFVSPVAGGGTGGGPWTQATVLSLRSVLLRGPGSHGRIYWPTPGQGITPAAGIIPSGTVTAVLGAATTMLNAINTQAAAAFGAGTDVGLVSAVRGGAQSPVIRVGVGQRLDHMESRERDIPEAHQFSNLTLAARLLEQADDDFKDEFRRQFPDAELP